MDNHSAERPPRTPKCVITWVVGILLCCITATTVTRPLIVRPMAPLEFDEPAYISGATQFFRAYFIEHDTGDDTWIQWLAYTQPPVTYYLLGGAFFITGHGEKRMNWRYWNDPMEPFLQDLLPIARVTISLYAVTTILVIYILGVAAFSLPVGLAAALLTLANPIFRHQAAIAYPDIPLLLTMTLTVLLILVWQRRRERGGIGPLLIHSLLIGMAIGISGSTRLNGALGGFVFAGFCLLTWLYSRRHESDSVAAKRRNIHSLLSLLVAASVSVTVFVALNPFLYPQPLNHTEMMIRHRVSEGRNHHLMEPDKTLSTASDRLRSVIDKTFYRQSSFHKPWLHWSLGAVLFLLGFVVSIQRERRRLRRGDSPSAAALLLTWFGVFFIAICAYATMTWDRYYLPLVPSASLIQALGIGFLLEQIPKWPGLNFHRS